MIQHQRTLGRGGSSVFGRQRGERNLLQHSIGHYQQSFFRQIPADRGDYHPAQNAERIQGVAVGFCNAIASLRSLFKLHSPIALG
jgi:hypothetical protein